MPEGTTFFPDEPILRVTAPIPQAQLVEPRLINLLHFQTLIASKAARAVFVAPDKPLVDFGLRRAHGAEAGVLAARATYLAGFTGSSTVLAEVRYCVPVYGTMAHSFVEAHDDEARRSFVTPGPAGSRRAPAGHVRHRGGGRKTVASRRGCAPRGSAYEGVRIDSGDLAHHARKVREILDEGGLHVPRCS